MGAFNEILLDECTSNLDCGCRRDSKRKSTDFEILQRKAEKYGIKSPSLATMVNIYDINLLVGDAVLNNLVQYYRLCKDSDGLAVTLSCHSMWAKNKEVNCHAKVIPAVPVALNDENVRIFLFDDNMNLFGAGGKASSPGICNLRNIQTGEFVEFAEGDNGFTSARSGRHTVIHHSSEYKNVLVQANILDAIEDPNYFMKIIKKYKKPSEQAIIFMDINSTIMCSDTVSSRDPAKTLWSTMFELIELKSKSPMTVTYEGRPNNVEITQPISLKALVKKLSNGDKVWYSEFYEAHMVEKLIKYLGSLGGTLTWFTSRNKVLDWESIEQMYQTYLEVMWTSCTSDGVATSWLNLWDAMKDGQDSVVLNSFGVDANRIVKMTLPGEGTRKTLFITVNLALWSEKDRKQLQERYSTGELTLGTSDLGTSDVMVGVPATPAKQL